MKTMEKKEKEKTTSQPKETTKRKITVTSSPPQTKKTKDIPKKKDTNITTIVINGKDATAANKASTTKESTVVINGKACVQRNLDFSGSQPHSKIPVSKQVRAGRAPGNRGASSDTRPRERLRSRHREAGSAEGRGQDSCLL